jgi:hypothetical protein
VHYCPKLLLNSATKRQCRSGLPSLPKILFLCLNFGCCSSHHRLQPLSEQRDPESARRKSEGEINGLWWNIALFLQAKQNWQCNNLFAIMKNHYIQGNI